MDLANTEKFVRNRKARTSATIIHTGIRGGHKSGVDYDRIPRFFRTRCQAKSLTSRHVRMRRVIFYMSNALRKLMISAQGLVLR